MAYRHEERDRWRIAQLLMLAAAVAAANYTRTALGPLQETVRESLSLSDNQTALLQGLAMALPLALAAVPVGLLADRISRKKILLVSLALAMFSSVLGAFSTDFGHLLISRCLTGLSLPGIFICAYAMAGDLFAPAERGRATMVVAIGEVAGPPAAFALGGAFVVLVGSSRWMKLWGWQLHDWGWSLLWMSGVLLPILLLLLLLREPSRMEISIEKPAMGAVWRELWSYRAMAAPLQLARAVLFVADGAVYVWGAPLFSRKFHLAPDRIGVLLGAALLAGGLLGPALGGPLVDWCQRHGGPRRAMKVLALVAFASAPIGLFGLVPNAGVAVFMLGAFLTLGWTITAAAMALTLIVIPGELRGINVGLSLVVGSVFFVGLAPLVVSGLSVVLGGEKEIGESLAVVCGSASLVTAMVAARSVRYFPAAARVNGAALTERELNQSERCNPAA